MKTQTLFPKLFVLFLLLVFTINAFAKDRDIVVAIIDTGVDVHHPLIREHLWENPREKMNLYDDDGNGYADDLHGWNFSSNTNDLSDNHGHGTHVAGIILQKARSERLKFMILKYYDSSKSSEDNLLATVKAIRYATKMGADIINYSGGGDERSAMEEAAIRDAQKKGILFVAAAGNEGRNTDRFGYYPAGYKLSNIISVAAMDSQKRLLASSNFGANSVDIVAPGKNIYSSLPGGKYGLMTGTSQATAWVSGLAASLMLRSEKKWSPEDMKIVLEKNAIKDRQFAKKIRSASRISTLQASNF
ncbi:S8 family peptidase [Bdellovibrio sp. 22V]|uniref:S8 family peptidase n=1 Tax=Bdellovibrio TaxID=958 RepID=UPI002543CD47|nr:S8 family peptidase [Bdellovibrio sp. 22V]WII71533.1 S8 family peptidase [Bdellovibrio sp. 22V]